jgi:glycosyltransferase involved in cell wall biosynthesis
MKGFFFGELPPKTVHGVSLSNKINLLILKKEHDIDCVEEFSDLKDHSEFNPIKAKRFLFFLIKSWRFFQIGNYDFFYGVIYLSSYGLLKNILLAVPFKIFNSKARIVLHFHRSDLEICLRNNLNLALFNTLDYFVDKYIVLSQNQVKEVSRYTSKRIRFLYNTIDEDELRLESNVQVERKMFKLLFLSNFIRQKGFLDLVEAQKQINELYPDCFELNCYGSFSNIDQNEINLEELKNSNIYIHERVCGERKKFVLNEADLIILPSYNEGLPLILLEALFMGKPIIISNVGYIEEVLTKDYPLYCKPGDVDSIVKAIIKFKESTDVEKLAYFMREVYRRFSFQQHELDLIKIFKE